MLRRSQQTAPLTRSIVASSLSHFVTINNSCNISQQIRSQSSSSTTGGGGDTSKFKMPDFNQYAQQAQQDPNYNKFPIVQLPAKSLWCIQNEVPLFEIRTPDFQTLLKKLQDTRSHYQYPSLSAPQIGWNVSVFVLYDGSVWINPKQKKIETTTTTKTTAVQSEVEERNGHDHNDDEKCWSWEPCASCSFLMHYIERPHKCSVSRYDEYGRYHEGVEHFDGMKSRLIQHEMDHLTGILFTRRIPNSLHVVPMDGFHSMSDWAEDYPSIEARSTNLYTLFFPPFKFVPHFLPDSEMMKRHYEDNVFPGHEVVTESAQAEEMNNGALNDFIEEQKKAGLWKGSQFSHNKKRTTNNGSSGGVVTNSTITSVV